MAGHHRARRASRAPRAWGMLGPMHHRPPRAALLVHFQGASSTNEPEPPRARRPHAARHCVRERAFALRGRAELAVVRHHLHARRRSPAVARRVHQRAQPDPAARLRNNERLLRRMHPSLRRSALPLPRRHVLHRHRSPRWRLWQRGGAVRHGGDGAPADLRRRHARLRGERLSMHVRRWPMELRDDVAGDGALPAVRRRGRGRRDRRRLIARRTTAAETGAGAGAGAGTVLAGASSSATTSPSRRSLSAYKESDTHRLSLSQAGRQASVIVMRAEVEAEWASAELGLSTRTARVQAVGRRWAAAPQASFPKMVDSDAELQGLYGLLENDAVDYRELLAGHARASRDRIVDAPCSTILIVHDTTEFSFGGEAIRKGLGWVTRPRSSQASCRRSRNLTGLGSRSLSLISSAAFGCAGLGRQRHQRASPARPRQLFAVIAPRCVHRGSRASLGRSRVRLRRIRLAARGAL